jgi:DNA-3-methyladenine glycosylase II
MKISIPTPGEFSFDWCLSYLKRSPREVLHRIEGESVVKAIPIYGETVVFSVSFYDESLQVELLTKHSSKIVKESIIAYVTEWFDLITNLGPFYAMAKKDDLLKNLVRKYYGYRIVGQPDLFESVIWAVLGQQINLQFAYTLKQRFVEQFGESAKIKGQKYFLFPSPQVVAKLTPDQLLLLQFSRQKAAYTIGIAQVFVEGKMSKELLKGLSLQEAKQELIKIKGIGNWTANYALMKTFRHPDAFPLEDAGVHNAIKNLLHLKSKPSLNHVKKLFKKYKGWEAYAILYLWKSL